MLAVSHGKKYGGGNMVWWAQHKRPWTDGQMSKHSRHIHTVGNSSPINRGRSTNSGCTMGDPHKPSVKWTKPDTEDHIQCDSIYEWMSRRGKSIETERRSVVTKGWDVGGMGGSLLRPWGFFVGWRKCYKIDCGDSRVNLSTYSWPLNSLRVGAPTFRVLKNLPGTLQSVPFSRLHIQRFSQPWVMQLCFCT